MVVQMFAMVIIWTLATLMVVSAEMYSPEHQATDCDVLFTSSQLKNGSFVSPNFPNSYPSDVTCRYSFQGQGAERVQLMFTEFDLRHPTEAPHDSESGSGCEESDTVTVSVHIGGVPKDLGSFCGRKRPPMLMSHNSHMDVTFTSRSVVSGKGFRANYSFVTDYGIKSGQRNTSMACGFVFRSNMSTNGTFTSPNFPGLYPRNTECHYLFYGSDNDCIYITFPYFDVEGITPCLEVTQSDYVEFSNFNVELMDRKMSRFCGPKQEQAKRSVSSDGNFFRVTFKSNDVFDATGFEAFYQFRRVEDPYSSKPRSSSSPSQDVAPRGLYAASLLLTILPLVASWLVTSPSLFPFLLLTTTTAATATWRMDRSTSTTH